MVISQLYSKAPSHSYTVIGIIETTLHLPVVSIGTLVSWPRHTCSDLTIPSLIAVQPVATCEAELFLLRSKEKSPDRDEIYFVLLRHLTPGFTILRYEEPVRNRQDVMSLDRTYVFLRTATRGNLLFYYPEALSSLLKFTVTHLPREEETLRSRVQKPTFVA
jgi:hypothetical protein